MFLPYAKQCNSLIFSIARVFGDVISMTDCVQAHDVREDITKLKEDIKREMANLSQALTSKIEAAGFNHQ